MANLEGQMVAGYSILSEIGRDSTGTTYQAQFAETGQVVALKVLSPALCGQPDFTPRFQQEAKAAATLTHPNVVKQYAAGVSDGVHCIVTELVDGEVLSRRLERKRRLEPVEAVAICVYVAQALSAAWKKVSLIHGNVSPDNVYLTSTGEVKLSGFGLPPSLVSAGRRAAQKHVPIGNMYYISPEQVRGEKDVDVRSDIYSLGAMLFHMLAGLPLYEGVTPMDVMEKHVSEPLPLIRRAVPNCPRVLVPVLKRMLAKKPKKRHQDYDELIADLLNVSDVLEGMAAGKSGRAVKRSARSPRPDSTLALRIVIYIIIILASVAGMTTWLLRDVLWPDR